LGFLGTIWECELGGLSREKEQRFPGSSGSRGSGEAHSRCWEPTDNLFLSKYFVSRKTEGLANTKAVKENSAIKQIISDKFILTLCNSLLNSELISVTVTLILT
jgi:hypothetical protein